MHTLLGPPLYPPALGFALCSEPSLQFSSVSLKHVCWHQKKAEGVGATLTPFLRDSGLLRCGLQTPGQERSLLWGRAALWDAHGPQCGTPPKDNLLYMQAKLPQEAWLHREVPWARECSLRLPHLLLVGQLTPKLGVDQPLSCVCWGSSSWNRLQKPPCSPPSPVLLTVHLFPRDRDYHLKTYKSVVPGSKLVDWLLAQVRL